MCAKHSYFLKATVLLDQDSHCEWQAFDSKPTYKPQVLKFNCLSSKHSLQCGFNHPSVVKMGSKVHISQLRKLKLCK